jgi:uncharacterized delta-60 repeat protein/uncharacterized repeat protein (TIGR01451 family)
MIFRTNHFFRRTTGLFLLLLIIKISTYAQPGANDFTFNPIDIGFGNGDGFISTVYSTAIQSDGKIIVGGVFTSFNGTAINRIARLNADGTLDTGFNPGTSFNHFVYSTAIQSDGKVIVGGAFTFFNGTARNYIARLNADGSLDTGFNPGTGFNNTVRSIAIQSDGKIIVGGEFTSFNGTVRNHIARLNADGSLDTGFDPIFQGFNNFVYSTAIQSDGEIIVGGLFTSFNGTARNRIARLYADGSLDTGFNPGTGFNGTVRSTAIQSDGEIIVGGLFTSFNGTARNYIARLNADGSLETGFNTGTGFNHFVYSTTIQSDGKIILGGAFSSFNGTARNRIVRLNADGSLETGFNTGFNSTIYSTAIQSDGKIIVGGEFGSFSETPRNRIAQLNADGSLDTGFNPGTGFNNAVSSTAIQSDGKIIVGGDFTSFNGTAINCIARLNADGSLDTGFNPGTGFNNSVSSIAIQSDGKIIVGGQFTSFNGTARNRIAQINADGSLDTGFNPGIGFNFIVYSTAIQSDGKIIVGGPFTSFNGTARNYIARLNADGRLDTGFNPGTGFSYTVQSTAIQSDGKIIVGGQFTSFNGTARNRIARINADGSLDTGFNPGTGLNGTVYSTSIQSDGKIIVGGLFTSFNGTARNYIARLNADGSLDMGFNPGFNSTISSIAIQSDGKIIVGGPFTSFNGTAINSIARLNVDGSLDMGFNPGTSFNNAVSSTAIQSDGKIIVGGMFTSFDGTGRNRIARLLGDPTAYNTIQGNIYTDSNNDCLFQTWENALSSIIVKAIPGPFYGGSDIAGHYNIKVDSGNVTYTLSQQHNHIQAKLLINQCAPSHSVELTGADKDTCCFNFANEVKQCALLNVSVQNMRMRRCFRSNTYVNYSNYGNQAASNAELRVVYPSYVVPISSVPMWTSKQDSVLIYNLGSLAAGTSERISIIDSVICGNESIRGLTQCIKATISPASNCVAESAEWDKSSIKVTGSCVDGIAHLVITNGGSGNMAGDHEYRVFVNDTLIYKGPFKLNSTDSLTVTYPAAGQTIRLEADQHPLHPGRSRPRATIENCGVASPPPNTRDLVITAPQDDLDEEVAITCNPIIDSYDPNDKLAIPFGVGSNRRINPGEEMNYTIRFQNTGTDTAYTVVIVDTLDIAFNVASFTECASSHNYKLGISGKDKAVLTFTFNNIYLPDSTTDQLLSNGLVSFRISLADNAPLGTVVHNQAHIFFDFNSAIITNETMHTVDITVDEDLSKGTLVQETYNTPASTLAQVSESIKIYPNPTEGMITVALSDYNKNSTLEVYSQLGILQRNLTLEKSPVQQVSLEGLHAGMYIYRILQNGEVKVRGILKVK